MTNSTHGEDDEWANDICLQLISSLGHTQDAITKAEGKK